MGALVAVDFTGLLVSVHGTVRLHNTVLRPGQAAVQTHADRLPRTNALLANAYHQLHDHFAAGHGVSEGWKDGRRADTMDGWSGQGGHTHQRAGPMPWHLDLAASITSPTVLENPRHSSQCISLAGAQGGIRLGRNKTGFVNVTAEVSAHASGSRQTQPPACILIAVPGVTFSTQMSYPSTQGYAATHLPPPARRYPFRCVCGPGAWPVDLTGSGDHTGANLVLSC